MSHTEGDSPTGSVASNELLPLAEAIKKARARDHAAFQRLYEHYKIPLWRRLLYLVKDQESAYDLFQETFLRVWKGLPEKSSEVDFEPWLYRIAKNLAIDHLRRTSSLTFLSLSESETDEPKEYTLLGLLSSAGHEEQVCEMLCLQQALEQISPQYRVCTLLQDVWGYSQREIAESLAISEKAVSSNVSRGRKQLRIAYQNMANGLQAQRTGGQRK
jgi:RNA polymerase sigma-70 factor, ECF subfamily